MFSISGIEALDTSRPVIFNTGGGDIWDTWRSGTGFLLRLHHRGTFPSRDFFITAHHVFKNVDFEINEDSMKQVWLFDEFIKFGRFNITEDILIPLWAYHGYPDRNALGKAIKSEDAVDLDVFELRPGALDDAFGVLHVQAAPLAEKTCDSLLLSSLSYDCPVWISGFPTHENIGGTIDYDGNNIMFHRIHRQARFKGKSYSPFVYKIEFDSDVDISFGLDGLSGSPIFYKDGNIFRFIGMALRGTTSSRIMHFLGAEQILLKIMMLDVGTADWHRQVAPDAYII